MPETRPWSLTCRDVGRCWVLVYRILYRFVASLARLTVRSGRSKDLEIIVLRHQLGVLRRQVDRPELTDADWSLLGASAAALPRPSRAGWLVTPATLLGWHRRRIAGHWTQPQRPPGRPSTSARFADSRGASQPRIQPGDTAASTANSPDSATASLRPRLGDPQQRPNRPRPHTLGGHLVAVLAVPGRCCLRLRHHRDRHAAQVLPAVVHRHRHPDRVLRRGHGPPSGVWVTQAARNLFLRHADGLAGTRALVRDRANQFIDAFDEIFRTERMKILKTPVRSPVANAFAERWIATLRRELLDRTIIWNRRQLKKLVVDYIDHYNTHRPHRSLDQRPPVATDPPDQPDNHLQAVRTARCDGLINEHRNAASPATTQYSAPTVPWVR